MNPYMKPTPTTGATTPLEADRALWGMLSGAALGAFGGGLFAGTRRKTAKFDLLNYVGFGAFVGAGAMGAWILIRRYLA